MLPIDIRELAAWLTLGGYFFLRIGALMMSAPILGAASVPVRVRSILALLITLLMVSVTPSQPLPAFMSVEGFILAVNQVLIGLCMGFFVQMFFSVLVIAGQTLAMTMGLGFAVAVDPQNGVQVPVLSQFLVIFSTLIFLAIDGHLLLFSILADSFTVLPLRVGITTVDFFYQIVAWGGQMFALSMLLALPVLTALLIINITFGIVTRAAPQLNIFAVGFPVTLLAGFIFLLLSLPTLTEVIRSIFNQGFIFMQQALR